MLLGKNVRRQLIDSHKEKGFFLEGDLLDLISSEGDPEFEEYLNLCKERRKANDSSQSRPLPRDHKTELISKIVKTALWIIVGVGLTVTGVYLISLFTGKQSDVLEATWSNIIGILLTNSFSIIGTIMGVKYASEKNRE